MNEIFYNCIDEFLVVYMDDLLVFSKNEEDHLKHLNAVLRRLKEPDLYVSTNMCVVMSTEMEFLDVIVGREDLRMDPTKIKVIEDWPRPESVTEVRSFLGLVQFFRRFISRFYEIAAPLTNLTKKNNSVSNWESSCDKAFETLKEAVKSAPVLQSPDWKKPFRCHVDASQLEVGGTLTQKDERGFDHPIAFYFKKLSPAEANYSTNDRELLGLISFLQRFRCYLEGFESEVFTDNQVLKHLFTKAAVSRKEARWLKTLGNFGMFLTNLKPGRVHVLGNVLSRAPHAISSENMSYQLLSMMLK
jgi:RNase H-like domain found in reverse transcriptase/Reverse transcriptase (RNA-dependent DNA polymerase)